MRMVDRFLDGEFTSIGMERGSTLMGREPQISQIPQIKRGKPLECECG
jgi:hypothetical protein